MTLDELNAFIEERDIIFRGAKNGNVSERERALSRTVKLMEETGELADEILGSMGFQREEKLKGKTPETLAEEFADVVITTLLIAKSMNVDVPAALESKIEKIRARHIDEDGKGYRY